MGRKRRNTVWLDAGNPLAYSSYARLGAVQGLYWGTLTQA